MTFERDAVVFEKNVRLARLLAAAAVLVIAASIGFGVVDKTPNFFMAALVPAGLWVRVTNENWRAKRRNARVRASAEGVFVDGVRRVELSSIVHGILQPRPGAKPTVRLRGKRRGILFELEVADEAEGSAFLRAIQHDAAARKATFRTLSPLFATRLRSFYSVVGYLSWITLLFLAAVTMELGGVMSVFSLVAALLPMIAMSRPRMIEVGTDGLSFSWLRSRRFVRFDDVASVDAIEVDTLRLLLHSGERVPLRTGGATGWDSGERAALLREALHRRIVEAMEAHRANVGPRDLAARLAPGARDENAWLADLKKLRVGEGGYRAAVVRDEDLWRVVEDPGAPEEARAAAAVLLRKTDGAKPRLRIAADAVASPRLRIALQAEEEDEAEEALKAYLRRSG